MKAVVRKGDTVVDVGAGTGFLAMLARRLGAERCYLIEENEDLARMASEILKRNRMTGCTVVHAHSGDVTGLPKADVIVSETLGNYAYEESIIEGLRDARRFLKPKGRVMPAGLVQQCGTRRDRLDLRRGHELEIASAWISISLPPRSAASTTCT